MAYKLTCVGMTQVKWQSGDAREELFKKYNLKLGFVYYGAQEVTTTRVYVNKDRTKCPATHNWPF